MRIFSLFCQNGCHCESKYLYLYSPIYISEDQGNFNIYDNKLARFNQFKLVVRPEHKANGFYPRETLFLHFSNVWNFSYYLIWYFSNFLISKRFKRLRKLLNFCKKTKKKPLEWNQIKLRFDRENFNSRLPTQPNSYQNSVYFTVFFIFIGHWMRMVHL